MLKPLLKKMLKSKMTVRSGNRGSYRRSPTRQGILSVARVDMTSIHESALAFQVRALLFFTC